MYRGNEYPYGQEQLHHQNGGQGYQQQYDNVEVERMRNIQDAMRHSAYIVSTVCEFVYLNSVKVKVKGPLLISSFFGMKCPRSCPPLNRKPVCRRFTPPNYCRYPFVTPG